MLYLESHVAVEAFTPQRAAVLDLLAAQAAISLENARLYADLQRSEAFLVEGESISHTGSWSWNAHTGKVIWSDEHYRIFGMEPVEVATRQPLRTFFAWFIQRTAPPFSAPCNRRSATVTLLPANTDWFVQMECGICMLSADPPRKVISAPRST